MCCCSALMVKTAVVSKRIALTTHIWAMIPYRRQFDDCISCIFLVTHALCFLINTTIFFRRLYFMGNVCASLSLSSSYSFVCSFADFMSFANWLHLFSAFPQTQFRLLWTKFNPVSLCYFIFSLLLLRFCSKNKAKQRNIKKCNNNNRMNEWIARATHVIECYNSSLSIKLQRWIQIPRACGLRYLFLW